LSKNSKISLGEKKNTPHHQAFIKQGTTYVVNLGGSFKNFLKLFDGLLFNEKKKTRIISLVTTFYKCIKSNQFIPKKNTLPN